MLMAAREYAGWPTFQIGANDGRLMIAQGPFLLVCWTVVILQRVATVFLPFLLQCVCYPSYYPPQMKGGRRAT